LSASINPGILPNAATPASHPDRRALLIQIAAVHGEAQNCDRRLEFLSAAIGETAFARVGWLSSYFRLPEI